MHGKIFKKKRWIFYFIVIITVFLPIFVFEGVIAESDNKDPKLYLNARSRLPFSDNKEEFIVVNNREIWNPAETAIIICDMWDQHWCKGASRRVAELAPYINSFSALARQKGVLIVHAPSSVVDYYKDHPARQKALKATSKVNLPEGIDSWCSGLDTEKESNWPVDQSDGGCDCQPQCKEIYPWTKQIESIEISDDDIISDSGAEIWIIFEQKGIKNIILVGVHTNMCVIGRPFGLRNMVKNGKNVVLCRDLTDTMYNHRMPPYINHFSGTDLVVEYIEKYVCPTILSTSITGEKPFRFKEDKRSRVVFISAESEYEANRTLPALAHNFVLKYGLGYEFLQGSTAQEGSERNYIPDMQVLQEADLVVLFARRRALPPEQMLFLREYLDRGRPLIGLRTSSHAFALREELPAGFEEWKEFDRQVLGGHYTGYPHGETLAKIVPEAASHPILKGLEGPYQIRETMYKSSPLRETCQALMMGQCVDGKGEDPRYKKPDEDIADEPVAWVNYYKGAKIFYTSMGSGRAAFKQDWFNQMLVNAVFWSLDRPVPSTKEISE